MSIDPMWIGVCASAIFAVVIGAVWYHPRVFGSAWARLSGLSPETIEKGRKRMPIMACVGFLAALLIAYVMSYVSFAWGFTTSLGALMLGFWCWAGFVAPVMLGTVLWEQKPFKLYMINVMYWFVAFLVMAQCIVFAYSVRQFIQPDSLSSTGGYDVE
jgi:hypothetical protein